MLALTANGVSASRRKLTFVVVPVSLSNQFAGTDVQNLRPGPLNMSALLL